MVNRNGTLAEELPPVLAYTALSQGGANPSVDPATGTFTIDGAGVRAEYKSNAALMREFKVTVRDSANTMSLREYEVQSATYDGVTDVFTIQVDPGGTSLGDFLLGVNNPEVEIVPYFLRLRSGGVNDSYPPNTEVRVLFGAVKRNPITGQPSSDPADIFTVPLTGELFTPDITDLNTDVWDFVRFKVEFLIDTDDLESARPANRLLADSVHVLIRIDRAGLAPVLPRAPSFPLDRRGPRPLMGHDDVAGVYEDLPWPPSGCSACAVACAAMLVGGLWVLSAAMTPAPSSRSSRSATFEPGAPLRLNDDVETRVLRSRSTVRR